MKRRALTVPPEARGQPLARWLAGALGVPAAEARARLAAGSVYVAGRRARPDAPPLAGGEVVTVVLEEAGRDVLAAPAAAPGAPRVLFEDAWVLALDKPAGLPAQATPGGAGPHLLALAGAHLGREAGLVHRLDRDTTGVTVFGKSAEATSALAAAFREGAARKRYLAACGPALPAAGEVDLPLSRDPARPGRWRATHAANGVPAHTLYARLGGGADFALAGLWPRTGRTHQLRAHLAALGCPILGDARYGGAPGAGGLPAPRCLLHAHALELPHPRTGAPLRLVAPLPADVAAFFTCAGVPAPGDADFR